MGRNTYFQFKQFRIEQVHSAMKVGVDGVLLGAWAEVANVAKILDVGTGTGLIALMLAQRSKAQITAIEIEKSAAMEARENVAASPWKDRIQVLHTSFQDFASSSQEKFDLIVSNPPYFAGATKAASDERSMARHNDRLSFEELTLHSSALLNENGRLAIIIPSESFDELHRIVSRYKLYLKQITHIRPKPSKMVNRVLAQWSTIEEAPEIQELCIYEQDGVFTEAYKNLTCDFYLLF